MTTDIHTLAGAYVLNAVDDLERAAFDRHLTECNTCQVEVEEMRETVALLPLATWSVPPPQLRAKVLTAVGEVRQTPPRAAVSRSHQARPTMSRRRWLAVSAAVAAVLSIGTSAVTFINQDQRSDEQQAALAQAQELADDTSAQEQRMTDILAAPDAVVRMAPMNGGGRLTVVTSTRQRVGMVMLSSTTKPSADKAFQVWAIRSASPVSVDVLKPGASSGVRIIEGLLGKEQLAVTVEPASGSQQPTSAVLVGVPPIL